MVNSIISYIGKSLETKISFIDKVDAPVMRLQKDSKIYSGIGPEKKEVSISDSVGNGVYIRQTMPEQSKELKRISSCEKRYQITTRCRLLYYSFTDVNKEYSSDKIKSILMNGLNKVDLSAYSGSATEISTSIAAISTDFEKIFFDETGKKYEGGEWPMFVAIDFLLVYTDINCDFCNKEEDECKED